MEASVVNISGASVSSNGNFLFGFGAIKDPDGRTIDDRRTGGPGRGTWYVAATSGRHFLRLAEMSQPNKQVASISVHTNPRVVERDKLAIQIGVLPEMDGLIDWSRGSPLSLDHHLFLIPEAKLLVILNHDKTKIVVRKLPI